MHAITRIYFASMLTMGAVLSIGAFVEYAAMPLIVSNGFVHRVVEQMMLWA